MAINFLKQVGKIFVTSFIDGVKILDTVGGGAISRFDDNLGYVLRIIATTIAKVVQALILSPLFLVVIIYSCINTVVYIVKHFWHKRGKKRL